MTVTTLRASAAGLLLAFALAGCAHVPGVYTYEAKDAGGTKATAFDATTYADQAWTEKVVPAVRSGATDVTTVAAAIDKDPAAAGEQYGVQAGTGSPYAYLVKGSGTVTKVDKTVPTGPMTVEVPQAGGKPLTVTIATGPVIAGTALRDGAGLKFGDFTNQIEYADVANKLNDKAKTEVVAKIDLDAVTGKTVTFAGAFSALAPGTIFLVPTELRAG
ncbi:DUF2291 family protein [Symbioplanes lichenis]|uniref:DUF2291 family protein n=1 Tax=Symbioplanes lichenis TaxID=1629072 RepID=UPI00273A0FE5|nr:DUF2291 domain-containing protein [Actinoplanes lichenis]